MLASTLLLALVLADAPAPQDALALVRVAPHSSQAAALSTFQPAQDETGAAVGGPYSPTPTGGIAKFFALGGKRPLRHVFAARAHASPADSIVVVHENLKKKSRLELSVIDAPKSPMKKPKLRASSKNATLGHAAGDVVVEAIGAIDVDAAGESSTDELVVVRRNAQGVRRLEILALPAKKKQAMGAPLFVLEPFFPGVEGEIVDVAGADLLDQGLEQLVLTVATPQGTRILLLAPPAAGAGLLASYQALSAGESLLHAGPFDHPAHDGVELGALVATAGEGREFRLLAPPSALDQPLPAPIATTDLAVGPVAAFPATFAFAAAFVPPVPPDGGGGGEPPPAGPPPATITGPYAVTYNLSQSPFCYGDCQASGPPTDPLVDIGPFPGFTLTYVASSKTLLFKKGQTTLGSLVLPKMLAVEQHFQGEFPEATTGAFPWNETFPTTTQGLKGVKGTLKPVVLGIVPAPNGTSKWILQAQFTGKYVLEDGSESGEVIIGAWIMQQ